VINDRCLQKNLAYFCIVNNLHNLVQDIGSPGRSEANSPYEVHDVYYQQPLHYDSRELHSESNTVPKSPPEKKKGFINMSTSVSFSHLHITVSSITLTSFTVLCC